KIKLRRLHKLEQVNEKSYTLIKKNFLEKLFSPLIWFVQRFFTKRYSTKAKEFLDEVSCRTPAGFKLMLTNTAKITADQGAKNELLNAASFLDRLEKATK